jgi:hypothetical protein
MAPQQGERPQQWQRPGANPLVQFIIIIIVVDRHGQRTKRLLQSGSQKSLQQVLIQQVQV